MNAKSNLYGCRKCFQKFKLVELSEPMQFCQSCQNSSISTSYKQCNYCKSDFKSTIPDSICVKCKNQLEKHGEPSNCTICKLQMVFGNAVICVRCSHYRSKFGDARQCDNCCQMSAFYKDNISRQKVDGKIFCWLCTYFYKLHKCKVFKSGREKRVDVLKQLAEAPPSEEASIVRTESSNSLLSAEPINKRSRIDEDASLMMYSTDSVYNEHLLKVNSLQEDIKQFRRRIIAKDGELMQKDSLITGLKADLLQKDKDHGDRERQMKDRWEKERQALTEKIRALQRENVALSQAGGGRGGAALKRRRQADAGLHYLTKNPLTRAVPAPAEAADSPASMEAVLPEAQEAPSQGDPSP